VDKSPFTLEDQFKRFKLNNLPVKISTLHWDDVESTERKTEYSWEVKIYDFDNGYYGLDITNSWDVEKYSVIYTKNGSLVGYGSKKKRETIIDIVNHYSLKNE